MSVDTPAIGIIEGFRAALAAAADYSVEDRVGLAVSGGGDSIAMMHLAARVIDKRHLNIVTVDHGLRPEASDEIALVVDQAAAIGLPHTTLRWEWDGTGNLQAAARAGRWQAIASWARREDLDAVFLGHTRDDQIETILLRLARGSGVDGLSAMSGDDYRGGIRVVRPLLDIGRTGLRDWLKAHAINWCDDPSNEDNRFDRVRARRMMGQLEELGLTGKRLLQTADHMRAARLSLQRAARDFADEHVTQEAGDLVFDAAALDMTEDDVPRRVMAAALAWVGGKAYRPRFAQLLRAASQVGAGHAVTLSGCVLLPEDGKMRLSREAAATDRWTPLAGYIPDCDMMVWDGRWKLSGPLAPDLQICALKDGLSQCSDWRETGLPRISLMGTPSVWRDGVLLAAPVAGLPGGWTAQIVADFHITAFAH